MMKSWQSTHPVWGGRQVGLSCEVMLNAADLHPPGARASSMGLGALAYQAIGCQFDAKASSMIQECKLSGAGGTLRLVAPAAVPAAAPSLLPPLFQSTFTLFSSQRLLLENLVALLLQLDALAFFCFLMLDCA